MGHEPPSRPPVWLFAVAFAVVYLGYGLDYLAIREGIKTLPPFLFAGTHVSLAGLLIFVWLLLRGEFLALPPRNFIWAAVGGLVVFVGGTGLVTMGETTVSSGLASILRSTTPIWVAVLEWLRPNASVLVASDPGRRWKRVAIERLAAFDIVLRNVMPKPSGDEPAPRSFTAISPLACDLADASDSGTLDFQRRLRARCAPGTGTLTANSGASPFA